MRRFYIAFALSAFSLVLSYGPVYAVGNVLVPAENNDQSVLPANPSPGSKAPSLKTTNEKPGAKTGSPSNAPLKDLSNPSTPRGYTPIPGFAMARVPLPDPKSPTQIIKLAAMDSLHDSPGNRLPKGLTLSMQNYVWGPDDISLVNHMLSIPADQIAKHCQLSIVGTLLSDTGGYMVNIGGSRSQAILHYNGKPSNVSMMAQAMCDAVPLPPNSGIVLQVGDKYAVYITQIQCPPPSADNQTLAFQYAGNGKAQCIYQ